MQLSVFVFALFLFGGCGGNNSEGAPNQAPDVPVVDSNSTSLTAKMSVYNGNSLTARTDGETLSISIQAFTKNDTPAEGKIVAQYIETDGKNGNLTPASVDLSGGFANFTYTAPANLQSEIDANNTGTSFRFYAYSSDDELLSDVAPITVDITFDTTSVPDDIGGNPIAQLLVSNGSGTITSSGESLSVTVLAKDSEGYPVKGGTVRVKYPANAVRVGLFSSDEVTVSTSGIAIFTYTGPDPLSYGGATFTFEYKENPTYTVNWNVYFRPTVDPVDPVAPTYPIATIAATQDITADSDGYTQTIEVLAFMSGNVPVPEGKISVIYPADVATKNIGTFTPATADIADGKATFTYSGPEQLVADSDQIFTFRATDYPTVSDTVTVSYSPKIDPASPVAQTINIVNDDDNDPNNGKSIEITKNNEVVNIRVRVFGADNNPFDGGNVNVQYPDVAVNGTDVGSFASLSVPCVNGVADFTYSAPTNINGRSDSFDFTFNHDSTNSPASETLTMVMNPAGTQLVLNNYILTMAASDGNNTMNIESSKTFTIAVVDDAGNPLTQNATYTLTNDYPTLAEMNDTTGAGAAPTLSIVDINANFSVTTKKKSGVFPVKVHVDFTDANGIAKSLDTIFNITIFSGAPTAMSISYVATDQDATHSQFIEIFSVKLTDKYNNPVNTKPYIHVGAIAGYAKDPTQYAPIKAAVDDTRNGNPTAIPASAYFTTSKLYNGNLIALREDAEVTSYTANQAQIKLEANTLGGVSTSYDLTNLDIYNNTIVTFGDGYVYHKSGKWDINSVSGADTIIVDEKYSDTTTGYDMGFAIGNNFRQDTCKFGQEWVLTTESDDGTYQVDENGYARVKMPYDYYLVGKDVIVYANLIGDVLGANDDTLRVGEAKKVTLRGHELEAIPSEGWVVPADSNGTYAFKFKLKDTVEWYRNANLGRIVYKSTGDGVTCYLNTVTDYRNCENGGLVAAYVDCNNTAADAGSVIMEDSIVGIELTH